MDKLSIIKVLKLFSAMGATRKELVKEFIMLLVNKEYANRWRDPSWVLPVLPDTDPDADARMKVYFVGKWMIAWTKHWMLQPEARFRIGLTIYKRLLKAGYVIIAKKGR